MCIYKLVLLRHGESQWNLENRFTGWTDVDLTENGIAEAQSSGQLLKNESYSFNEDDTLFVLDSLGVLVNDFDADPDQVLSSYLISNVSYGTIFTADSIPQQIIVSNTFDGRFFFNPDENYYGTDEFIYAAFDGYAQSNLDTVSITINPVNDAPQLEIEAQETNEEQILTITVSGTDVDLGTGPGDENILSYTAISSNPEDVGVSVDGDQLTMTPALNSHGDVNISVTVTDDGDLSSMEVFILTVNPINDAPTTNDIATTIDENRTARIVGITLDGSDVDGDALTYSVVTDASNGTTSISGATLTYTANQDWNGVETFTYKANDGTVDSNTSTITVTVTAVNDAPTIADTTYTVDEDWGYLDLNLPKAVDIDDSNISIIIVSIVDSQTGKLWVDNIGPRTQVVAGG